MKTLVVMGAVGAFAVVAAAAKGRVAAGAAGNPSALERAVRAHADGGREADQGAGYFLSRGPMPVFP